MKQSSKKWMKTFKNILHRSFSKIRITNKQIENKEVHLLMKVKTEFVEKINEIMLSTEKNPETIWNKSQILVILKEKIDNLDEQIANICALKNFETIKNHYANIIDEEGGFNIPKMWGLKKKLNLSSTNVPSAKLDKDGNLITTKNGLLALYKNTYIDRLSHKQIRPEYEDLKKLKENLFELRLEIASQTKSEDWDTEKVEKVCKSLKK